MGRENYGKKCYITQPHVQNTATSALQLPCSEIKQPNNQSKVAFPSNHIFPRTQCLQIPNTQSHFTFGSMWHMACLQMLKVTPIKDIKIKSKGSG
jgi:hypothetical protein